MQDKLKLGSHCRSDQLDQLDCQKFPTELDKWPEHDFYSSATRSYSIVARALKTPTRLQPDCQPDHCSSIPISQQEPYTICSRTPR